MAGTPFALLDALAEIVDPPVAMAAAVVDNGELFEAYDLSQESSRFEFGSIGKTMTAQILASLVLDGRVNLHDTIGTWLDAGANARITVGELATHTSGLPRMPDNSDAGDGFDPADPYASYSAKLAEAALREASRRDDNVEEYSNFGYQLLGLALERAAATSFADLLRTHVFEPFTLTSATVGPGPNQVQGYMDGEPTPAWAVALAGPGGVNGTLEDLVAWGRAVLDPNDALRFALDNGLAWVRNKNGLFWHNGGTYGSHACLVVDPAACRLAACLVATHDLPHVDHATFLACQGHDPMAARPQPAGDEPKAKAIAFFDLLVAERWTDAQAMMTDETRIALPVERIGDVWRQVMGPRGTYVATTVIGGTRTGDTTEVTVELGFVDGLGKGILNFDIDGLLYGVRIA